jgi:hypothetical protein
MVQKANGMGGNQSWGLAMSPQRGSNKDDQIEASFSTFFSQ